MQYVDCFLQIVIIHSVLVQIDIVYQRSSRPAAHNMGAGAPEYPDVDGLTVHQVWAAGKQFRGGYYLVSLVALLL